MRIHQLCGPLDEKNNKEPKCIHYEAFYKNLRTVIFMYFVSNAVHVCEKELGKEYLHLQGARNVQDSW